MDVDLPDLGPAKLTVSWSPLLPTLAFELWTDKLDTREPESVFVAFPFSVPDGRMRYEVGGALAEVNEDQLPNGCRDWYSVHHVVDVGNRDLGITWATRDAFLVELCGIQTGKWLRELPVDNQTVFANVANNLWFTNYKASQGGEHRFRFAAQPHAGGLHRAKSLRFGHEQSNPLQVLELPARQVGPLPLSRASLLQVSPRSVAVLTVKQPEEGEGLIVRLQELSGRAQECSLTMPRAIGKAALCDLVERPLRELTVDGRRCRVALPANGIVTVRVEGR